MNNNFKVTQEMVDAIVARWRSECFEGIEIIERAVEKMRDCGDTAKTSQRVFVTQKLNDLICAINGTTGSDLEVEQIEG